MVDLKQMMSQALSELAEQGFLTNIRTISAPQGAWFVADGKRVLNLCSNNYLGLANHPRLRQAAQAAIEQYGVGPGAVRSIAGTQALHIELENRLSQFKHAEATVLFQSGFCANLAVIPLVVGENDVIFSDELNHASIIDGCRLSKARSVRYKHNDAADLARQLEQHGGQGNKLVISDGVFSMDGDICPLDEIVEVAERLGAWVMVDDAHGEGVLGSHGRGIVDHFNLGHRVQIEVGTLSKAFGVMGGFVSGSPELIAFLKQRGRPFIFSSALTPADVAAGIAAVDILEESDELVTRLWENSRYFKAKMKEAGFDLGVSQTPITPVMIGDAAVAGRFSRELFERSVFAQAIGFPTVARDKARIRAMLSAGHTNDDLDFAVEKFTAVGTELGVI